MAIKQVLAALQITSEEVRLLVGEYYNARIHVLARTTVSINGIEGIVVKDPDEIVKGINKAIKEANEALGVEIERVLLVIPSYRSSKETIHLTMKLENEDGKATIDDIQSLIKEGYSHKVDEDKILVNWAVKKFYADRIANSYAPVGEKCSELGIDMELYCADKMTTYDYVRLIEKAGISTIDIVLDLYADVVETNLAGINPDGNVILLSIEAKHSYLVLVHKGSISAIKSFNSGYGDWISDLSKQFSLSYSNVSKILFHHGNLTIDPEDNSPIYIWNDKGNTKQISNNNLFLAVKPSIDRFCENVYNACKDLFTVPEIYVKITGKGCEIDGLGSYLNEKLGVKCDTYYPDVMGARDSKWTTLFGTMISFINIYPLYRNKKMSVDLEKYQNAVMKQKKENEKENGFKDKIKAFISIDKGENL